MDQLFLAFGLIVATIILVVLILWAFGVIKLRIWFEKD